MRIIFAQHPSVDTFYVTSDDQAFHHSHDAKLHAGTLDDKKVDEVERSSVVEDKIENADEDAEAAQTSIAAASEKASLIDRYKGATGKDPVEGMTAAEMEAEIATIEAERQAGLNKGNPDGATTAALPATEAAATVVPDPAAAKATATTAKAATGKTTTAKASTGKTAKATGEKK